MDNFVKDSDQATSQDNKISITLDKLSLLKEAVKDLKATGLLVGDQSQSVDKELFFNTVERVIKILLEIREELLSGARDALTERQFEILTMEEDTFTWDPSIQFFGVHWALFFTRMQGLERKIVDYTKHLHCNKIEMMSLASILKTISQTNLELHQHSLVVMRDNITQTKIETQPSCQKPSSDKAGTRMSLKLESPSLEISQCFSERLRRKSFNFRDHKFGVSIQHSLRRRPSQVPRSNPDQTSPPWYNSSKK